MTAGELPRTVDAKSHFRETSLDFWVLRRPVWTFSAVAVVSTILFVLLYWMVGEYDVGGFRLDDTVTGYVGSLATTVVALAGALVSVILARLALKLGREAKDAAERGNEIQAQMQKFADPAYVGTREGHKAAAELDLLGTLLCVYAAEVFSSAISERPIEPIRHTYRRGNDLISDPALYRYCAQLIGTVEATTRFAAAQAKIYEATRLLGRDGELGRNDRVTTARNAEKIALEIAILSRRLEHAKRSVLVNGEHHLHAVAKELKWERAENRLSGCESTARMYLLEETAGLATLSGGKMDGLRNIESNRVQIGAEALLQGARRSVVHVLEIDLPDLLRALGSPLEATKVPLEGVDVVLHNSLRDFALASHESKVGRRADVIIAGWDSTLRDEPESVTYERLYRPWEQVANIPIDLESEHLWSKATMLAKNPWMEQAMSAALRDLEFLRGMRLTDVSDELYQNYGIDPAEIGDEVLEPERRIAARSAKRLRYIHAAIENLREIQKRKGSVIVPDRDPYTDLTGVTDRAVVVIRPHFARIDLSVPGSEWEQQNQWFVDYMGGYSSFRWEETA